MAFVLWVIVMMDHCVLRTWKDFLPYASYFIELKFYLADTNAILQQ